ncbi:MAG TPA: autotransporter domain-containing protein, partial [Rhizomicrobium sp.]|nr:autotransporter domain-containing protein [Rhizomicrobium sp.]
NAGSTLNVASSERIGSIAGAGNISINLNQRLVTMATADTTLSGVISGLGGLAVWQGGRLTLTGANTFSGGLNLASGTVVIGNSSALGTGTVNAGIGGFEYANGVSIANAIALDGVVITEGGAPILIAPASLATPFHVASGSATQSGVISGVGGIAKTGTGTLIVTGNNTYTGGTTISAGTLQLGNGGTGGAIAGNVANAGALAFNRSDAATFAGVISGAGAVTKAGAGTLTLTGANTYTGATTVSGGTLAVNGSIASATTVASGGTLGGTGTVGGITTIQSGGTLAPGNSVGTLTINGNLSLQAGSTYAAEITPAAADRVTVSGTTSIAGSLNATFQSGVTYAPASYTLISSTGALSGTFSAFNTVGLPGGFRTSLSYSAGAVSLLLERSDLLPLLGGLGTVNQVNVAGGIDRAVLAGATAPASFQPLYNMSGTTLGAAINQLDGQINAQVAEALSSNYFAFLRLLMGEGGSGGNGASASYAPGKSYAAADAPKPAQLTPGELNVWGAVFGGETELSASAATGAAGLYSDGYRFAAGLTYAADEGLLLGAGIAAGQDNFDSGNGRARGGDLSLGFHARQSVFDSGYLSAAIGFGWTSVKTMRTITISGTDVLQGKPDADTIGGRVEGGYRIALDESVDLTPFAAIAIAGFDTPAYTETALGGSNAFALTYQARSSLMGNTELGARLGRSFEWAGSPGRIELVAGWAYSVNDRAISNAAFQSLAGSSFQLLGVNQAKNSAILGVNLEGRTGFGLDYGLKLDSRVGDGSSILTGTGRIGWRL